MRLITVFLVIMLSGCAGVSNVLGVLSAFGKSDSQPAKMEMRCKADSLGVIRCREQ